MRLGHEAKKELESIALALVADHKGILAIDESPESMDRKFAPLKIDNTPENRRRYREMLLTPPKEAGNYLSGVILNEETLAQTDSSGAPLIDSARKNGILVGVKLDKGLLPLREDGDREKISTGLEDLRARCRKYKEKGASFAKWRSVFSICNDLPSECCISKNCEILSEYAVICQQNGLVPVVEPEVLFDGGHGITESAITTASVISCLFYHLNRKRAHVPGLILKVGFVTPGSASGAGKQGQESQSVEEVADQTVRAFLSSVPPHVPGIVFLSGGHPEDVSVEYLKKVNSVSRKYPAPWKLSYSFGRALQDSVLKTWQNSDKKKEEAQNHLLARARICTEAVRGE